MPVHTASRTRVTREVRRSVIDAKWAPWMQSDTTVIEVAVLGGLAGSDVPGGIGPSHPGRLA